MWFCSQIITKKEFGSIFGPASMHALGHIAANLSFAAVAISLTHTVKTLEPAFNVVLMKLLLGEATPLPAVLSLIPIIVRTEWLSSILELVGLSSLGLCDYPVNYHDYRGPPLSGWCGPGVSWGALVQLDGVPHSHGIQLDVWIPRRLVQDVRGREGIL